MYTLIDLTMQIKYWYVIFHVSCFVCILLHTTFSYKYILKLLLHIDVSVFGQGACVKKLTGKGKIEDNKATKQIVALLSAPLDKYNDIVTALKLSNYPRVMEFLDTETNKVMATVIIQSIMKNKTNISTADKV